MIRLFETLKRITVLLVFVLICLLVGWFGGAVTESSRTSWYAALEKPLLNPPDWVFAPVWTTLYIFMAIAGWRIWSGDNPETKKLKLFFVLQLILNGVWSFLFFGLRNPGIALADIVALEVCLIFFVSRSYRVDRWTGIFLTPYLLWVSFATYLNLAIWWLNR